MQKSKVKDSRLTCCTNIMFGKMDGGEETKKSNEKEGKEGEEGEEKKQRKKKIREKK